MNHHPSAFIKWITLLIVLPFMVIAYTKLERKLSIQVVTPAASITGATPVSIGLINIDKGRDQVVNNNYEKSSIKPVSIFALNTKYLFIRSSFTYPLL